MRKSLILICLIFISISHKVTSQNQQVINKIDPLFQNNDLFLSKDSSLDNIEGSPFLTDYWNEGIITTKSGTIFTDIKLKYDSYIDELLAKKSNRSIVVPKAMVKSFQYKDSLNDKDIYFQLGNNNIYKHQIFEDDQLTITKTYNAQIVKALPKTNPYSAATPSKDKMLINAMYIFGYEDGTKLETKGSFNDFYRKWPKQKKILKKFIKDNKIKGESDEDWIKVATYLVDKD
ncbi:MAG: hypothetical protein AAF600_20195 [Bacteroidota bacterium]